MPIRGVLFLCFMCLSFVLLLCFFFCVACLVRTRAGWGGGGATADTAVFFCFVSIRFFFPAYLVPARIRTRSFSFSCFPCFTLSFVFCFFFFFYFFRSIFRLITVVVVVVVVVVFLPCKFSGLTASV